MVVGTFKYMYDTVNLVSEKLDNGVISSPIILCQSKRVIFNEDKYNWTELGWDHF